MPNESYLKTYALTYLDQNGNQEKAFIDKYPDVCPICGKGIEAKFITAYGKINDNPFEKRLLAQLIFRCPIIDCQALFIAYYSSATGHNRRQFNENIYLRTTAVLSFSQEEKFDDEIIGLSPKFVKIFTQAKQAEEMRLDEICGFGYRKALEFLIKDYLCAIKPSEEEIVKNMSLGDLIVQKISDEHIKKLAGLAKKIGNDEAHYEKKLGKLNIEDMKKLIKLSIHWISISLMTDQYSKIYDELVKKQKNKCH